MQKPPLPIVAKIGKWLRRWHYTINKAYRCHSGGLEVTALGFRDFRKDNM